MPGRKQNKIHRYYVGEVFKLFLICPLFQKALLYFEIYSLERSADPSASTQNADLAELYRHISDKFFL